MSGEPPISAVLWDCDGVLQHGITGVLAQLADLAGPEALPALFEAERPALRGKETLRDAVGRVVADLRLDLTVEQILPMWDRYELDDDALAVLAAVRASGYPCYLATNQQDYRRDSMRPRYDPLVDGSFYSCEMGVAKPEPAFFRAIVTALDVPADHLLFFDDSPVNVTAARAEGLHAEHIGPEPVGPQIAALLAGYGALPASAKDALPELRARP
jgi:putative hydrolase of the HAD superfamily